MEGGGVVMTHNNIPTGNYKKIKKLIKICLDQNMSVLLTGHPGVGKSAMAKELAEEYQLPLVDIRLSSIDPSELAGVRIPDKESGLLKVFPPEWVPKDRPVFLLFDEINSGITKLHQSVAYQIVLDRILGSVKFHPETKIMACGNLPEDNAIVTELSSALNNRFLHFQLEPDVDAWLEWARSSGITPMMRGYIKFRGIKGLYNNTGSPAFPSPRSIERADVLYREGIARGLPRDMITDLIASAIGMGDAIQVMAFEKMFTEINVLQIINTGTFPRKEDPSFLYALTFSVASFLKNQNKLFVQKNKTGILNFLKNLKKISSEEFIIIFFTELSSQKQVYLEIVDLVSKDKELERIIKEIIQGTFNFC